MIRHFTIALLGACWLSLHVSAQTETSHHVTPTPRVDLAWNRFYDHAAMMTALRRMEVAWPGWLEIQEIGRSHEGRPMLAVILCEPSGRPHSERPAMYIDANVHGNEIQGTETVLYTLWYLLENKDRLPRVKEILGRVAFYCVPTVNPDGREHWFRAPNTSSSSRSGKVPMDDDRDGLKDEDGPDDLDGDGSITRMRKRVDRGGTHIDDPDDPRLMRPAPPGREGQYILLGSEGIDNDADGRINEDGPGGYDMNRNWPSDWQPTWIQYGAGDYPLSWPETRAVGDFIMAHPNIAGIQSYHNSGGMILRGPGTKSFGNYPRADVSIYDALGKAGEEMLPHYRYMVLWKDLYPVHGGFVTWGYEGLGIFSFTNELWSSSQYGGEMGRRGEGQRKRLLWDDRLELGRNYKAWTPYEHPFYGSIEIGGWRKTASRVPPLFMLEELCHRNAAFTIHHAAEMPELVAGPVDLEDLGGGLWRVRAEVRNDRLIPTVSARAREKRIGLPDFFELEGQGIKILSGGLLRGQPLREKMSPVEHRPRRLVVERGVPSRGLVRAEWLVDVGEGDGERLTFHFRYRSQKGGTLAWQR